MNHVQALNQLASFLGRRDLPMLSTVQLQESYGLSQVDVFVLFGGSILAGVDVLAEAMSQQIAKHYIIVGGVGHTTAALRENVLLDYPDMDILDASEAEIFQAILLEKYGYQADELEVSSTNCGNNITYLLELLAEKELDWKSMILSQDATMQYRMSACLEKYCRDDQLVLNYASYVANFQEIDGELSLRPSDLWGMWSVEKYIELLMGEIPRLRNDETGYGPNGRNFIAAVDLPNEVEEAFEALQASYGHLVRQANPAYADKK
ncbi:YdcF family protein [Streptococcus gallinaceus]|uniref:Uncharacterized SAM-binding protein YcdF (DUF218 family) n=1 Tax=Streptococcus gallinaceus TaxID=165758 RepID=A0ABV2JKE5_9STRE|nr:YdcF family protein [Streptococcus gallinaceus]MCP1639327.1 uncharacterized SAM-binding protein YcdF (DUF218 family) [Streptococcus gallinaceus]MCP1770029.1 uncharacterized SAM-binding protein YcdF (DUF218 family) [Streptococcus gallinaceus]